MRRGAVVAVVAAALLASRGPGGEYDGAGPARWDDAARRATNGDQLRPCSRGRSSSVTSPCAFQASAR